MKSLFSILFRRPQLAAVAVSLGLLGLSAHAAPPAAPTTASGVLATPPGKTPPVVAPQDDIFDIRPPIHIPGEIFWAGWAAGAFATAALGYGAWRLLRRKLRAKLPYEVALEKLLAARQFLSPEQARAFSDLVSEVVRSFIEQTFPVRAAHRTTEEFLRRSGRSHRQSTCRASGNARRISRPLRSREVREMAAERPANGSHAAKRSRLHPRRKAARESASSQKPGPREPTGSHPSLNIHRP